MLKTSSCLFLFLSALSPVLCIDASEQTKYQTIIENYRNHDRFNRNLLSLFNESDERKTEYESENNSPEKENHTKVIQHGFNINSDETDNVHKNSEGLIFNFRIRSRKPKKEKFGLLGIIRTL